MKNVILYPRRIKCALRVHAKWGERNVDQILMSVIFKDNSQCSPVQRPGNSSFLSPSSSPSSLHFKNFHSPTPVSFCLGKALLHHLYHSFPFPHISSAASSTILTAMGQRHQLFVVARVNGRYRTLCAIHHQWLYGQTALKRCLGVLKIFADPANAIPLKQELIAAQRQDEDFWIVTEDEDEDQKNSHVPFPFVATCLITGASFGPDDGYYHQVSIVSFNMAYDEGDNNNGERLQPRRSAWARSCGRLVFFMHAWEQHPSYMNRTQAGHWLIV